MKRCLLLFTCFFTLFAKAQNNIKYYDSKWKETEPRYACFYSLENVTDSGISKEDFYLATRTLQMKGRYTDLSLKQRIGKFYWFYANGNVSAIGEYILGKKNGSWTSYYENGAMKDSTFYVDNKPTGNSYKWYRSGFMEDSTVYVNDSLCVQVTWYDEGNLSSAGRFINNKKNGSWNYYHNNGQKSATEIYQNGILINTTYYSDKGDIVDTSLYPDKSAQFSNNPKEWAIYLSNNLYHPKDVELVNTDKIVVVVSFEVDPKGKVVNAFVQVPFHPLYDEIALKVIRNSPKWKPARVKNRYVTSTLIQPIGFAKND